MIDKEIQKLSRKDLLQIMVEQSKENDSLKLQIEELKKEIEEVKEKLDDKNIKIEKAGTLAEASFYLNGVFDAAEAAAQQYLDNLKVLYEREKENCEKKEEESKIRCAAMIQVTEERCRVMKENAQLECKAMEEKAKEEIDKHWDELSVKLEAFYCAHEDVRSLLSKTNGIERV